MQLELITFDGRTLRLTAKMTHAHTLATRDKPAGVGVGFVQPSQFAVRTLCDFVAHARRHERVHAELPVLLQFPDRVIDAVTFDVSLGGCYAACDHLSRKPAAA